MRSPDSQCHLIFAVDKRINLMVQGPVINESDYSEDELRCFPFIAIGLYLAAAGQVYNHRIPHTYVMMEPQAKKSMAFMYQVQTNWATGILPWPSRTLLH